jgi:CMP-N-acetylneuraminic acid synthetase
VLEVLNDRREIYGHIILLQPTSPLRTSNHIDEAFALIEETDAKGSISVCRTEHPIEWMGKISTNRLLDSFFQQTELSKQSQAFDLSYQVNGAVYIVPVDSFLKEKTVFLSTGMVAYIMDRTSSIDIDDKYDLRLAEWLLRQREDE